MLGIILLLCAFVANIYAIYLFVGYKRKRVKGWASEEDKYYRYMKWLGYGDQHIADDLKKLSHHEIRLLNHKMSQHIEIEG